MPQLRWSKVGGGGGGAFNNMKVLLVQLVRDAIVSGNFIIFRYMGSDCKQEKLFIGTRIFQEFDSGVISKLKICSFYFLAN